MIVVDASAMMEMLMLTDAGGRVRERLLRHRGTRHAPHLLDLEVLQVTRRFARRAFMTAERARQVIDDLADFPIRRHRHTDLLVRVFELRDNLTAYDAVDVALAEALDASLVTCDETLASAPGTRARVEVLA